MKIDWWTLGLQAVNAIVLLWLLGHFFFRPVAAMMQRRQDEVDHIIADAEAKRSAAQQEREAAEAERKKTVDARVGLLGQAAAEATKTKEDVLAAARKEADDLRQSAAADIEAARKNADKVGEKHAGMLAISIAQRLLGRLPDDAVVTPFLPGLHDALASLTDEAKSDLSDNRIRVSVPRALSRTEKDALARLLTESLGEKTELEIDVEPAVLAGLELTGGHVIVRNSFRADLERIAANLGSDG